MAQWMPMPIVDGCPPGLQYLTMLDQILIHQKAELLEAITGFETKNRYEVKNSMGQQCYYAAEESGVCMRICCNSCRGFTMHVLDNTAQEVIRMERPLKICAGCCWLASIDCCAFNIKVEAPEGNVIGHVRQMCSVWRPRFDIMDADEKTVLKIVGPWCILNGVCCMCDFNFDITTPDGQEIGKITKQYSGVVREAFTDATNFSVTFPKDLDVKVKATVMGAAFLIDMMYFEDQNQNDN